MSDGAEMDDLQQQITELELSLAGASSMARGFDGELQRIRGSLMQTTTDIAHLERGMSHGLRRAFDAVVLDGAKLSDALRGLAMSISQTVYAAALKPVTDHFGGMLARGVASLVPFEKGAAFAQGRVTPFAKGGVVTSPVQFPMRGGTGLMGEAGPEAILPLSRGRDGRLGVRAEAMGAGTTVVMNISTPDVQGFQRSQSQISARAARLLARSSRIR